MKRINLSVLKVTASILGAICCLPVGVDPNAQTKFPTGTFIGADLPITFTNGGKLLVKDRDTLLVEAVYVVSGDQIIFTDKQGKNACTAPTLAVGKYRWKYDGRALRFTKVEDRCEARIRILTMLRLNKRK